MKNFIIALALAIPTSALVGGCKEDEAPPPLPSAAPVEEAPAETLQLVAEEVEVDAGTDAGAAKKYGKAKPKGSLSACCAALTQNAENAPEPTATYMKQAAATCNALVGQGQGQAVIAAAVSAALKGASLPGACL